MFLYQRERTNKQPSISLHGFCVLRASDLALAVAHPAAEADLHGDVVVAGHGTRLHDAAGLSEALAARAPARAAQRLVFRALEALAAA